MAWLMALVLLFCSSAAMAGDGEVLRFCTDYGGLIGTRGSDGTIDARINGVLDAMGTEDDLVVSDREEGTELWRGALAELNPVEVTLRRDSRVDVFAPKVAAYLEEVGQVVECSAGGAGQFRLGRFPEAIPLLPGQQVMWASTDEALVRGPTGAAWFAVTWQPHPHDLAAELLDAHPDRSTAVWVGPRNIALVMVSQDSAQPPLPGAVVEPSHTDRDAFAFLTVDEAVLHPLPPVSGPPPWGAHLAGWEVVVELNRLRVEAGLEPVRWSETLAWSSLGHCAYTSYHDERGERPGHYQDPESPVFLGHSPSDRGGAAEVVGGPMGPPGMGARGWVETPFHRQSPMAPGAAAAGACFLGDGNTVMEVTTQGEGSWASRAYPPDGARDVPLLWDGGEIPPPLPMERFPERGRLVGFTLTAGRPCASCQLSWVEIRDPQGALVSHVRVDAHGHTPVVHLIPTAPLKPSTTYEWTVVWDGDDGEQYADTRRFTTTGKRPYWRYRHLTEVELPAGWTAWGVREDGERTGRWRWSDAKGRPRVEANFERGALHGTKKIWDERGVLRASLSFDEGIRTCVHTLRDESGRLVEISSWTRDRRNGETTWYARGEPARRVTYDDGVPDGPTTRWAPDGSVILEGSYAQGRRSGTWTEYADGEPITRWNYENGVRHGLQETWEDGVLVLREEYERGQLHGTVEQWDPSGEIIVRQARMERGKVAEVTTFTREGKPLQQRRYEDGAPHGVQETWQDGVLIRRQEYEHGQLHGATERWWSDGTKLEVGAYRLGDRTGTWRAYNPAGELVEEATYRAGELHGPRTWVRPDTLEVETGAWVDGQRHGLHTVKTAEGQLLSESRWDHGFRHGAQVVWEGDVRVLEQMWVGGKLHGPHIERDAEGEPTLEGQYEAGERVGTWRRWIHGLPDVEVQYRSDARHGLARWFHESGEVACAGRFVQGRHHGVWRAYDLDGEERVRLRFNMGTRVAEKWAEGKAPVPPRCLE